MAKLVFFGTPLFAKNVLEIIFSSHQVLAVVTQPDRPFGRKQEMKASEVKKFAQQKQIPFFQPQKLDDFLLEELKKLGADYFLVVAFGQIFPKSFLETCPCINIHASILPHLRGASPLQEMILQDCKEYGVSAMRMEEGLDCGEILGVSVLQACEDLTLMSLSCHLAQMGGKLANRVLQLFPSLKPLRQNACDATFCKKIKKEEGRVCFKNAREVFVKFLAFTPWPSIFLDNGLKLLGLDLVASDGEFKEGEILEILQECVVVGCVQGKLKIYEVQPPSKQKMQAVEYLRGKRLKIGDVFC